MFKTGHSPFQTRPLGVKTGKFQKNRAAPGWVQPEIRTQTVADGARGPKGDWGGAPKSDYLVNADRCPRFLGAGKRDHFNLKGTT